MFFAFKKFVFLLLAKIRATLFGWCDNVVILIRLFTTAKISLSTDETTMTKTVETTAESETASTKTTTTTASSPLSSAITSTTIAAKTGNTTGWTRLNYKGIYHDNRRLLKHRANNCQCHVCYREIYKLPPAVTHEEYVTSLKSKMAEKEIRRTKKMAMKDVKAGKQRTMDNFFRAF
jgi:hypothetical protein